MEKKIKTILLILLIVIGIVAISCFWFIFFFRCPDSEWVNCMPGSLSYSSGYCQWVLENCPGVQPAY